MYVKHLIEVTSESGEVLVSATRTTFIPRYAGRTVGSLTEREVSDLAVEESDQAAGVSRDIESQFHRHRGMAEDREILRTMDPQGSRDAR